jgi:multidrug resistance efflux pump
MKVRANLKQSQLASLMQGQPVTIRLPPNATELTIQLSERDRALASYGNLIDEFEKMFGKK